MKVVVKYTLVLAAALIAALSLLAFFRVEHDRERFIRDMKSDHRVVGRVLQTAVTDIWLDEGAAQEATKQTNALLDQANEDHGAVRFSWEPGPGTAEDQQGIEQHDFVSRFPVRARGVIVGSVVGRESLDAIDRLVRSDVVLTAVEVALIVIIGLALSLVLGRWLVGRPIGRLVQQARQIGRGDFSGTVAVPRSDELGELAAEMRAMSEALAGALAKLEAESDARLAAVEQLRHSERLSTVGKLAAGIAHELGTPLSIIGGHAQMIAGREVAGDAALRSAEAIDREVARVSRIVRQLLDFARRKGPEGTACQPIAIAQRCAGLLAPMMATAKVSGRVEPAELDVRALIDEDSLQQVITNLLVNAIQAMETGGELVVSVSRVVGAAPGSAAAPTPRVRIDVQDTGPGIPEAARAHLFEPFFTTKGPGDGTGLGLAVVHGIVADHGGWITVESSDAGSRFSIYLQEAA